MTKFQLNVHKDRRKATCDLCSCSSKWNMTQNNRLLSKCQSSFMHEMSIGLGAVLNVDDGRWGLTCRQGRLGERR
jgi:hypothetical protein